MGKNKYRGNDVLFICGGKWQLPWLQFLKEKGHRIVLVDPFEDSICVPYADEHIQCDARNTDFIFQKISSDIHRFCLVTSDQTDVSTDTVAILSHKLGLQSNKPETVLLFSNKWENRKFTSQNNLGHFPRFAAISKAEELNPFFALTGANEFIIKPADAQSSRGVFVLNSENQHSWQDFFKEAKHFSASDTVIAEQMLKGTEITLEGLCLSGKHHLLAHSRKKHFRTGIASDLMYPSGLAAGLLGEIEAFHNGFVEATGLQNAITHAEYMVDESTGEFWLIEAACRGGGSLIPSHIVPWVSGVNVYELFYAAMMGETVSVVNAQPKSALLHFFEFPSGKVESIEGLEKASSMEGILRLELEFNAGDTLKPAGDDRGRQGYVIILAETDSEINARLKSVADTISVKIAS